MTLNDEIIALLTEAEKNANAEVKQLLKVYKRNLDEILEQIADIYIQYTQEGELKIGRAQRLKELAALKKQLAKQLKDLGSTEIAATQRAIDSAANSAYYGSLYTLDKGMQYAIKVAPIPAEFVKSLAAQKIEGKTFSKRIWANLDQLAERVARDVERAIIQGRSPEKLERQIKKDYGVSAYQAKRLINTETARAVTQAQEQAYRASGVVDIVMWDATLEANTCSQCAELDGKQYLLDEHPQLPQHPNCRCCLMPVVESWEPKRKRQYYTDENGQRQTSTVDYTTVKKWRESRGI